VPDTIPFKDMERVPEQSVIPVNDGLLCIRRFRGKEFFLCPVCGMVKGECRRCS
jgi:hypothetical protein